MGPAVVAYLQGSDWSVIDCGTSPENVTGVVVRERPDLLVVVDAAYMGLAPGSFRRLPFKESARMLVSTHSIPLPFLLDRIRTVVARVVLIGVEPRELSFGASLSMPVRTAVKELVGFLKRNEVDAIPRL